MVQYVTNGAWGTGTGAPLPAAAIDGNFYELRSDLDDVIADPPTGVGVASIAINGLAWVVTLTDSTVLAPLAIPVIMPRWRGEWAGSTAYEVMDQVSVATSGIYIVLNDHTSAAVFDQDEVGAPVTAGSFAVGHVYVIASVGTTDFTAIGASGNTIGVIFTATGAGTGSGTATPKFYQQLWGFGIGVLGLDGLSDVDLTGAAEGDVLTLVGGTWMAEAGGGTLDGLTDVDAPTPTDLYVLTWDAFLGMWVARSTAALVAEDGSTSYTLGLGDAGTYRRVDAGSPATITIPAEASVNFPIGAEIAIEQSGTDAVTLAPDVGVTLNCAVTHTPVTNGQFAVLQVKKVDVDEWTIFGNLAPT